MKKTIARLLVVGYAILLLALLMTACTGIDEPKIQEDFTTELINEITEDLGVVSEEVSETIVAHVHDFGEWITLKNNSCTEDGMQERACPCGEKETQVIDAIGHTEVVDEAVAATCEAAGKTEGKHCSVCSTVIVAQKATARINHVAGDWIVVKEPEKMDDGLKHKICVECSVVLNEEIIPKIGSVGLEYEYYGFGDYCKIIGIGTCKDTEIVIPEILGGYRVYEIGAEAFANCKDIVSVIIPNTVFKISDKAFADCTSLKSIVIPESITTIGNRAFYGCSKIEEITIPKKVTKIGTQIFYKAKSLKTVYYNSSYVSQDNQFLNLNHIIKIVFGGETVPEYILNGHIYIQEVELLDGVHNIGLSAFAGCEKLASVKISNSLTQIANSAFYKCASLQRVDISDLKQWCMISFGDSTSNPLYYAKKLYVNGELLTDLVISSDIVDIPKYSFVNCDSIRTVTIPRSVVEIGKRAFWGCSNIKNISLSEGLMAIGVGAFRECTSLVKIEIPSSVTKIETNTFNGCVSLESITLHEKVESIGDNAFSNCALLKSIDIPNSVMTIGKEAFMGCSSFTSITIPDSIISIEDLVFSDCSKLSTVIIPESVARIDAEAFINCKLLKNIKYEGTIEQWNNIKKGEHWCSNEKMGGYAWNITYSPIDCTINCTDGSINNK